ncbi:PRTG [Branchiostoma lanceolatum]|uniref:PRTG protein n=1 Tax=Branchiostoma lanceolatum TaxID=7740 RepID=A0A8J9ZCH4_BRALA|nr:PRTG [Branchiostoma lanceolatum]
MRFLEYVMIVRPKGSRGWAKGVQRHFICDTKRFGEPRKHCDQVSRTFLYRPWQARLDLPGSDEEDRSPCIPGVFEDVWTAQDSTVGNFWNTDRLTVDDVIDSLSIFKMAVLGSVFCSHLGFLTEPQDVIAKKNQTVWLDCRADGDVGTVNVTWHRRPLGRPLEDLGDAIVNDTRRYLLHTNGTLKILSFRPHRPRGGDEGTYWCLVKSPAGAIRSKDAHVQVADAYSQSSSLCARVSSRCCCVLSLTYFVIRWRVCPQLPDLVFSAAVANGVLTSITRCPRHVTRLPEY